MARYSLLGRRRKEREDSDAANGSPALSVQTAAAKYFALQNENSYWNGSSSLDFSKSPLLWMYGDPRGQACIWYSRAPPRLILKLLSHTVVIAIRILDF